MTSAEHNGIENVSWRCVKCTTTNCSSFLYQGFNVNVTNSYCVLAGIPGDDSVFYQTLRSPISPLDPPVHSSPHSLARSSGPYHLASKDSCPSGESSSHVSADTNRPGNTQANFRIVVANCDGARSKQAEIAQMCDYCDPDDIIMCETKIDKHIHSSEFLPKNYTGHILKDRKSGSGGVLIAIKSKYAIDEVEIEDHDCEIIWAKITLHKNSPMFIGSFYRPPSDSIASLEALEKSIASIRNITRNNPRASIVIGGDFNAGDINWETCSVSPGSNKPSICQKVIDILNEYELTQLQKSPTHMEAILDLFATNKPGVVKSINNGPGISYDHNIIIIDSDVRARTNKKSPRKIYKWAKADWDKIKADTSAFADRYQEESRENSIEENHKLIEDHLKDMLVKHVPSKLSRTRIDLPWLTPDLKRKCRRNQRLYNKAKKSGKDKHKKHYKTFQKATRTALKQARWRYINEILQTGLEEGNS